MSSSGVLFDRYFVESFEVFCQLVNLRWMMTLPLGGYFINNKVYNSYSQQRFQDLCTEVYHK